VGWADRLNAGPGRLTLGPVDIGIYHWAELADTVVNPPHRHTHFEVCWVEGGTGRFVVDGAEHPIGPGSLLFARPGVRHQIISDRPPGIRLAWVAFHLRAPTAEGELAALFAAFASAGRALARDADGRVAALWSALRATGGGPALPGQDAATTGIAQALLVALAQAGAETLRPRPSGAPDGVAAGAGAIRQALRYVHDNLDRSLPVEELARHVHLSRRQLTRLFTDHVGKSPAAYVEHTRLDHAAALLVRTDLPIKRVAAAVGYSDAALFTRAFSRRLGAPPGRFRRSADLHRVLTGSLAGTATGPAAGERSAG
jgi:AraC family L-rhamnose operon transcriptional activator RhaR